MRYYQLIIKSIGLAVIEIW